MVWQIGEELVLTKGTALALPFIKAGVAAGMSFSEVYSALGEFGLGARKQNVNEVYRALSYAYESPDAYIPTDINQRPNASLIPTSVTRQNRTWRTTMWYDVYDPELQEIERKHLTLDEDDLLTVGEYYAYTGQYINKYPLLGKEVLDIGFVNITFTDFPRVSPV